MGVRAATATLPHRLVESRIGPLLKRDYNPTGLMERVLALFGCTWIGTASHLNVALHQFVKDPAERQAQADFAKALIERALISRTALPIHVAASHLLRVRLGEAYTSKVEQELGLALSQAAKESASQICKETLPLPDGENATKALSKMVRLGVWAVAADPMIKDYQRALRVFFDHVYKSAEGSLSSHEIKNIEFKELLEQFIADQLTPKTSWKQVALRAFGAVCSAAVLYDAFHYWTTESGDTPVFSYLHIAASEKLGQVQEWVWTSCDSAGTDCELTWTQWLLQKVVPAPQTSGNP